MFGAHKSCKSKYAVCLLYKTNTIIPHCAKVLLATLLVLLPMPYSFSKT